MEPGRCSGEKEGRGGNDFHLERTLSPIGNRLKMMQMGKEITFPSPLSALISGNTSRRNSKAPKDPNAFPEWIQIQSFPAI